MVKLIHVDADTGILIHLGISLDALGNSIV